MTANEAIRRLRMASALTALVLGGLVLVLLAVTLPVAVANHIFRFSDVPNLVVVSRPLEPAHVSVWLAPDGATARGMPHGSRASTASS